MLPSSFSSKDCWAEAAAGREVKSVETDMVGKLVCCGKCDQKAVSCVLLNRFLRAIWVVVERG